MKRICVFLATALLFASVPAARGGELVDDMIERSLDMAARQALILAHTLEGMDGALPRNIEAGQFQTTDYEGWVSGFFPGLLWMLYEDSGNEELRRYAEMMTARVEPAKTLRNTHDLGFMLYCSFGQGYRITGNPAYLAVIKEGTDNLLTRFNPRVGLIQSWESDKRWKYPVIIDNMMNLEMLCFVTAQTGDRSYADIAMTHADNTMKHHFRPDYSTWHVISYDANGKPRAKKTAQGYSDDSAWARGQAWGLYGYTMMYRETHNPAYLEQARHIARFLLSHPRLPEDKVPYWDFDAPDIPNAYRDASAACIMASALIELSQLDPSDDAVEWLDVAEKQLRTLSGETYLAEEGELDGFILRHSVGALPYESEIDVPLTYADYYFVEALLRLKALRGKRDGAGDRAIWVDRLTKTAKPVLENLAAGTLKKNMPYETISDDKGRRKVSYLEAVGRTICGIAPWLELGPDGSAEGRLRERYINLVSKGLKNAVDPQSGDYLLFSSPDNSQPLVDAAFLAEGVLRAPEQIWGNLDEVTRAGLVREWKASRTIRPYESNWLLFASMVEAALLEFTGECDNERLTYGVKRFMENWYKGDGIYGDGEEFHLDYYNSFVIHPMLTEVLSVMEKHGRGISDWNGIQKERHGRYAAELERMISPEGTFPVTGRSITYRCGAFHALSDAALLHLLPDNLNPAQVRSALTAVIERQMSMPYTYDARGWLRVGYAGSQPYMSEAYINTGSEYLCTSAFVALGLSPDDPFWTRPAVEWSAKKAWSGLDIGADHAL